MYISLHSLVNYFYKTCIIFVVFVLLFTFSPSYIYAATYYVANAGNDSCDGTSQTISTSGACAWKTIAKVNSSTFSAGDSISFKKGDTWREQLNIPSAGSSGNPITFNSYGSGNSPKIYGSTVPTSWTTESYSPTPTLSRTQVLSATSASASVNRTYSSAPTEGNLLVAVGWGTNTDSNASISGWTKAVGVQTTSTNYMAIFYKAAGAGESSTVTLDWTGSTATQIVIEEWSGLISPVLDKVASTANTGGGVTSRSSGTTATTTGTYEILIAAFGHGSTTSARSYTNSFTEDFDVTSSNIWQIASRTVTATGTYETTQSWTTSRLAGGAIATFKGTESPETLYYTSQSSDPGYIWFIDTGGTIHKGNKVATKDLLLTDYDWWFDSSNNRLYVNAATDPLTRYSSVEVTDTTRNRGIFWTGTGISYITVDGFEIAFLTGVGIVARGDYWTITNNYVHHLGNETGGHSYGIELQTSNNSVVANNIVHDTYRTCYYMVTSYSPYISQNNVIESNTGYDCSDGLILANTEATNVTFANTIIRYNNLYHTAGFTPGSGFGINIVGLSAHVANSFQVYYNTISVKKAAIEIGGYVTNTSIYNNSIISSEGKGISIQGSGNSGLTLKNNLVANAGLYGLFVSDNTQITSSDYNLWYAPSGTSYANINGTNYTSSGFTAYKSATGWDTNGLWQNPFIVSTTDFQLQTASAARDTGTDVNLTRDYSGTTVPQGSAVDIGAYEFIPLTVTINQSSGQSDPTNSTTVNFTVVFSESVSNFETGDVTLSGTAGATTGDVTGSGTTYNVAVTGMTGSGTVIASLAAGVATGTSTHSNNASTSTDDTVTFSNNTTSTNNSSGTIDTNSNDRSSCGNSVTSGIPDLFEIRTSKNTATLFFSPPTAPYSSFYIAFSTKPDSWEYGIEFDQNYSGGVLSYTINLLQPNTKYYFMVRSGNGCATGNWSRTMTATTATGNKTNISYKNFATAVIQKLKAVVKKLITSPRIIPAATPSPQIFNLIEPPVLPTNTPKPKSCILWWCFNGMWNWIK